ncbi:MULTISPECIES: nucleic acid/nucleotide deaminase domain-containing protein [Streptomyces]|uniref:nucleic acid/nucleotide deaminase domain-containing protein n=1 Tax=Streptomyces TaxID=1883 RepID=UPI001FB0BD04|nr:nucleic acid/nucleotide deaminase domain-containing protein [Streptomyces sp. LaPpAH-199]
MARRGKWPAGSAEGEGHAEDHILEQLAVKDFSPKRISALYTERQPCPVCGPNLENLLKEGTEITWSVQRGANRAINRAFEGLLVDLLQKQGRP